MNTRTRTIASLFSVSMAAMLVGAMVTTQIHRPELALARPADSAPRSVVGADPAVVGGPFGLDTFREIARQNTPGVVNISTTRTVRRNRNRDAFRDFFGDDMMERFFGPQGQGPGRGRGNNDGRGSERLQSVGSGFIIDREGYVLTNRHVIDDVDQISVTLSTQRPGDTPYEARLVGKDARTDVALLKIEPKEPLTPIQLGDSDKTEVGDWVMAIGNPFGLGGNSVTVGVVSYKGRPLQLGTTLGTPTDMIQTDASINPGNSGGALVNLRGEMVGVNTAIIGPTGGNVGIGFAIPANMVRAVVDQILRFGEVRRGRMGVTTQDLTPELAKNLGVAATEGAVVAAVEKGSAADQAGLQPKDVVIAVNDRPIRASSELRNRIGLVPVGEEVEMTVLRGGGRLRVRARIAELFQAISVSGQSVPQLAGLKVADVQPGMPTYGRHEGVVVTGSERESAAFRNGLRVGDVIYGVNQWPVRSLKQFTEILRTAEQPLRLALLRGEYRITLFVR